MMKRSMFSAYLKGFVLLIFIIFAIKSLLVADTPGERNDYFQVAPAVSHLNPSSVKVSWTIYPDFNPSTHYQVQLNHTFYGSSTKETTETLVNLKPGATYDFTVVTFNNGSAAGVSSPTRVLMAPEAPSAVGTYNIGTASVGLFWGKVNTALKYRIYQVPDVLLKEVDADVNRILLTGLPAGQQIILRMTAINATGESLFSENITVQLLPTPPVLSIIEDQIGPDWFAIKWQPVPNASYYHIFVNDEEVASLSSSITEHRVENLPAGTAVSVKMTLDNTTGSSEASEPLIIQLLPATPILAASQVSSFSCTLQWSVANGATYYKVYQDTDWAIFNVPSTINNVTVTENIYAGMTATFTVKAGNGTGESNHSNPVVVTFGSDTAIIREGGDLETVRASFHQFSDKVPTVLQGKPLVWVYFPPELEGPALALEASYFDELTALPELKEVKFVGVFTRDTVMIKGSRRPNLEWKKASSGNNIQIPGHLPMVRFYGADGVLRNMIRISMAIISPYDVFKELPEVFERSENMVELYQENQQRFDELHQNQPTVDQ